MGRLVLLAFVAAMAVSGEEFHRAYTQRDGAICFDLPAALASSLDLPRIARRALGAATFDKPTAEQLKQHYFEVGRRSVFPFEAALPEAAASRRWLLLSAKGTKPIRPARLRGEVSFDGEKPDRGTPPRVTAQACSLRKEPEAAAAFVIESRGEGWVAQPAAVKVAGSAANLNYRGFAYALPRPDFGSRSSASAIVIERGALTPLALVDWSAPNDSYCGRAFSLHELGAAGGAADSISTNGYDCDV